jgi:Na+/H+-dicarboxylate symporter
VKVSLNQQILIGAVLGVLFGLIIGHAGLPSDSTAPLLYILDLIGRIFISLLKMILVPLVLTSIISGIANLQKASHSKFVWPTFLIYALTTTTIAIITGLLAMNIFKPGAGLKIEMFEQNMSTFQMQSMNVGNWALSFFSGAFMNPVTAMSQNNILAVVVFSVFVGIAIISLGEKSKNVLKFINECFDITMTVVGWIMRVAPLGIMGLLAKLIAEQNMDVFGVLGGYIAIVITTTLFHGFVTLPSILWAMTGISPLKFFHAMKSALLTAFSTSSSAATLPVTMRCVTENLKVDKPIANFVLPIGATVNMDGTALYEAMAALFIANLCGIELSLTAQIIVALTSILASVGAPGIPSAGMVTMIMVLQAVGLPAEAVAILIPIDRPLDAVRTAVNVAGDSVGACVVQKISKNKSQSPAIN